MLKSLDKTLIKHIGTDMILVIPVEKNSKFIFFSIFWFTVWYVIYKFAIKSDEVFVQIWLIGWTIALFIMMLFLLWFLFGTEQIRVSQSGVNLSIVLFGIKYSKTIKKNDFKSCTYSEEQAIKQNQKKNTFYLTSPAKIKVSSYSKDYFIGSALDDSEAKKVVKLVNVRL